MKTATCGRLRRPLAFSMHTAARVRDLRTIIHVLRLSWCGSHFCLHRSHNFRCFAQCLVLALPFEDMRKTMQAFAAHIVGITSAYIAAIILCVLCLHCHGKHAETMQAFAAPDGNFHVHACKQVETGPYILDLKRYRRHLSPYAAVVWFAPCVLCTSTIMTKPAKQMRETMQAFAAPDGPGVPNVMLVSLMAGGQGITLTTANHVFLMDCWWNGECK